MLVSLMMQVISFLHCSHEFVSLLLLIRVKLSALACQQKQLNTKQRKAWYNLNKNNVCVQIHYLKIALLKIFPRSFSSPDGREE